MQICSYRDLTVWQKAIDMVAECYRITESFPNHQLYGLTSQLQRAAVSVPANIAEGHGRRSTGDYLRHLAIARGSLTELETHILIALRLDYIDEEIGDQLLDRTDEVGRMLASLISSLQAKMKRDKSSSLNPRSSILNPANDE